MAADRSRRIAIGTASVAVHLALLAVVALQAPRLVMPKGSSGPPEAVIPILIMPRVPPPAAPAGAAPQPQEIRLHRRRQTFADEPPPTVAPLVAPASPPAPKAAPPPIGPRVIAPPAPEDALAVNARNALRGALGCANPARLSREERQKCEDQLAIGAKQADFPGLGIEAGKAAGLAAAAARRERDNRYRDAAPVGVPTPQGGRWDAQRSPPFGASNLPGGSPGGVVGADKPAATVPF